jgi:hypothetical protein
MFYPTARAQHLCNILCVYILRAVLYKYYIWLVYMIKVRGPINNLSHGSKLPYGAYEIKIRCAVPPPCEIRRRAAGCRGRVRKFYKKGTAEPPS